MTGIVKSYNYHLNKYLDYCDNVSNDIDFTTTARSWTQALIESASHTSSAEKCVRIKYFFIFCGFIQSISCFLDSKWCAYFFMMFLTFALVCGNFKLLPNLNRYSLFSQKPFKKKSYSLDYWKSDSKHSCTDIRQILLSYSTYKVCY